MKRRTKWILGLTLGLVVGLPAFFVLLVWRDFHIYRIRQQRETVNVIQRFHDGYNAGQLDSVCEAVYGCSLSPSARESWNSYVRLVRNRAGSFRTVSSSEVQVHIEPPGVRATYVSSFEKTECTEIFDLKDFDVPLQNGVVTRGPLKIVGYHVLIDGKLISPP